jgi:hypothetical protein
MSQKTAKERVKAIHDCLAQNKKIKTISEIGSILKISSLVPRMLKDMNVLMYNVSGKVIWNANMPYTLEMEEIVHAKTLEYSRQGEARRKAEAERKEKIAATEAYLANKTAEESSNLIMQEISEIYWTKKIAEDNANLIMQDTAHDAVHDTAHDAVNDPINDTEYKVSFVEHAIISLEVSVADLHKKLDALTAKVSELNVDGKIRPRVRLTPTPSTNTTKHNFFGEDL